MPTDDEIVLMQRITRRDQNALADLYQRYGALVYSIALRVLDNAIWAEEVLQDTFVKVWREPLKWNPNAGRLVNWLATIARYTAIDRLRKEHRQPPLTTTAVDDLPLAASAGNVDDFAWQDQQMVYALMDQLPQAQLEVIRLAFWHGLTHVEISERLNLPLGTVKSRLQLGLRRLRLLADEQASQVSRSS